MTNRTPQHLRHCHRSHRALSDGVAEGNLRVLAQPLRRSVPALQSLATLAILAASANAQQSIGAISTTEADVTGTISVHGTTAEIQTSGNVHAGNTPAQVKLTRGGQVTICSNSTVAFSQANTPKAPLLVALQRGATELKLAANAHDVIITTDLRFDLSNAAPLDLQLRVTSTGDTCVSNRGKDAPILHVTEQLGAAGGYFIKPNQHVLFEHGSIHELVDRETSNCGCPGPLVLAGNTRDPHPFPEAISQGLEEPKVPQSEPGVEHTTISASVSYNGRDAENPQPTANTTAPAPRTTNPQTTTAAPQTTTQPSTGSQPSQPSTVSRPFRAIGHFFKRIFTPN